jgi:hypothetical protein
MKTIEIEIPTVDHSGCESCHGIDENVDRALQAVREALAEADVPVSIRKAAKPCCAPRSACCAPSPAASCCA